MLKIHSGFLCFDMEWAIQTHNAKNAKIAAIATTITTDHTKPASVKHPKPRAKAYFDLFLWAHQHDKIPRPKKNTDIGVTI